MHPGSNAEPIRSLAVCQRTRRLVAKPSHLRQLEGQSCLQGQQPGPVHAQLYRSERRCRDSGLRPFSLAYPSRLTRGRWATCRNPVWAASIVPRGQLERARELGWGGGPSSRASKTVASCTRRPKQSGAVPQSRGSTTLGSCSAECPDSRHCSQGNQKFEAYASSPTVYIRVYTSIHSTSVWD